MNDVDIASYADDNSPFFGELKSQNASKALLKWFNDNQMIRVILFVALE